MTPMQKTAWIARASTIAHIKRVDATIARIASAGRGYAVSVSWGKDSVVMLDLAVKALGHVVAVHARYPEPEELPDIPTVRDAILARIGNHISYEEVAAKGEWEIYEKAGRFFLTAETKEERAILRQRKIEHIAALEGAAAKHGARGMMVGTAAHESYARRMNVAVRGDHYQAIKRTLPTLLPLARWDADDVIAYHLGNSLPWLHVYDVADDPRRARSEFAFVCGAGEKTRRHGGWDEWASAYPELWRTWQARWGI